MHLKVYTVEDLFELGKAIIRNETGVPYPFSKRTLHRALLRCASLFGADGSIQTLRLAGGITIDGLSGTLLERKGLEYGVQIRPATPARLTGRIVPLPSPTVVDITLPKDSLVIRPATSTQSALEFQLEAACTIAAGGTIANANTVSAVCTTYGTKGNGVPSGTDLELKNPVSGIQTFRLYSDSAGGYEKQTDQEYRTTIREAVRGSHEATWGGLLKLVKTVKLETGNRVTVARVYESFIQNLVRVFIDDGSGNSSTIGPIDTTTYGIAGYNPGNPLLDTSDFVYVEDAHSEIVQLPVYHLPYWNDTINSLVRKYKAATATWSVLVANTDYFINIDTAQLYFTSMLDPGDILHVWFHFYTGLVGQCAKYVNGIVGDPSIIGWRPAGQAVRIRGPYSVVNPTVSGTIIFEPGFDSAFGRALATTYVVTYLNSIDIGEPAEYGVVNHIVNSVPGAKSVKNLLLGGAAVDYPPTSAYGVVRGNGTISL